jgi:LTXXQ motif family protein
MTPPGRLRVMTNRISATLEAVRIVRPTLDKFYNSLSDQQQARSLIQLPIERVETVIHPTGTQKRSARPPKRDDGEGR